MLIRTARPEEIALEKGRRRRLSAPEAAHLDKLLDDALRETFPASDPIAITIDKSSQAIAPDNPEDPDNVAISPEANLKVTEPKLTLMSPYGAHLWAIKQIFDWWLSPVGGRAGK